PPCRPIQPFASLSNPSSLRALPLRPHTGQTASLSLSLSLARLRFAVTANPAPPPPPIEAPPAPDPMDTEEAPKPPEAELVGSEPDDAGRTAPPPPPPAPTPAPAPTPPAAAEAAAPESVLPAAASPPPAEVNGSFDRRKKRKADEGDGSRTCSCKKSKCLKLYCVCYASGSHCTESCGCEPCHNNKPIQGAPRIAPPPILPVKFAPTLETGQDTAEQLIRSPMDLVRRKCTCKKSGCLKKYCDCFQGGAGCSINCKCDDCRNPFGKKVGVILDVKSGLAAPLTLNDGNGAEIDSSDDEDDYYMNRTLSPIPPSPVSRESSFQQETLVGIEVQTMNGHLYPKPLTQVRPESSSWQLSRRPGEESRVEQWNFSRRPSEDRTSDAMEGHADPKFQRNNKKVENHVDKFSIPRCIEVMNAMTDLSPVEKSLAPDVFLNPSNREIFLSLCVEVRTLWLKRKMKSLV
ncbi:hypothetical protein EJB05_00488, partial [Eragrostis curvula]